MRHYSELRIEAARTDALIREAEALVIEKPERMSLAVAVQSLRKLRRKQNEEIDAWHRERQMDCVRYLAVAKHLRTMAGRDFASMILNFDDLVAVTTASVAAGKPIAKRGDENMPESPFKWGYCCDTEENSMGFMLTTHDRDLLANTPVEEAVAKTIEIMKAGDSRDIEKHSQRYGKTATMALRRWCLPHIKTGTTAHIAWQPIATSSVKADDAVVPTERIVSLHEYIKVASDMDEKVVTVKGVLFGVDTEKRWFAFRAADTVYAGKYGEGVISMSQQKEVPHAYTAEIKIRTRTMIATGESKVKHTLMALT